ncbi:hypothetical protein GHT06_006778 [Daphnia sinensis]|uniref:Uncharacterized protein n=1 Tax=Daphnia sinensis TaxID=1820382 RepID=A0AAD5KDX7_9CRUS|nr:hypothetical protein GHT06_006778 [Daphnia sinensis]
MVGSRTAWSSAMRKTNRYREHCVSPTMHRYDCQLHDGDNKLLGTHSFHAMLLGWRNREFQRQTSRLPQ